ncbi:MAG: 30S ribosomal protein S15 [Planctomycetes bacterium]|nr:30S ribosomal protein S15 [Planctomycetota bacterium]
MALTKDKRSEIITEFRTHENDSGSPEVQIALLSKDIEQLTEHLRLHKKDFHSRRGLLAKVSRRTKLLRYLDRTAHERYVAITQRLGLRR